MTSRQERKVTGQALSSRTNVRDLRRISPLRRNDKLPLDALSVFARVTPISLILYFAALAFFAAKFRIRILSHYVTFVLL